MNLWLDAQLSPRLALWISAHFPISAIPLRDLGLRNAGDSQIFIAAKEAGVIIVTKDSDFVRLLEQRGAPPKIL